MMQKKSRGDINGFLDERSHIKGELHFADTFMMSGKVTGSVISKGGILYLHEDGEIEGEVQVHEAAISGKLQGELRAEKVEITSTGKVIADIYTPALVIQEGAFFEGRCFMRARSEPGRENVTQIPLAKKR